MTVPLSPAKDKECYPFQPFGHCGWGIYVMLIGAQVFLFFETYIIAGFLRSKLRSGKNFSSQPIKFWVFACATYTLCSIELLLPLVNDIQYVLAYVNEMAMHIHDFLYLFVADSAIRIINFTDPKEAKYLRIFLYVKYFTCFAGLVVAVVIFIFCPTSAFAAVEILIHLKYAFYDHSLSVLYFIFVSIKAFVFGNAQNYILSRRDIKVMRSTLFIVALTLFVFIGYVYSTMVCYPSALDIYSAEDYVSRRMWFLNINPMMNFAGVHVPFQCLMIMIYILDRANGEEGSSSQVDASSENILNSRLTNEN